MLIKKITPLILGILFGVNFAMATTESTSGSETQPEKKTDWSHAVYVSLKGDDAGDGTKENPIATIQKALSLVGNDGGVIGLFGGTWHESVKIPTSTETDGPLTICAVPGEKVIFDGALPMAKEKCAAMKEMPGVYVVEAEWTQVTPPPDIWDPVKLYRYRKVLNEKAVAAHPGSCAPLDEQHFLVHCLDGGNPAEEGILYGAQACAFYIERPNVTLHGIEFRNYTGGRWAGPISLRANHMEVSDCDFFNVTRGILTSTKNDECLISHCRFKNVGQGIFINGKNTIIEDCHLEGAGGDFAFEAYAQDTTGIEFYSPAAGGTVRNCLTRGFDREAGLFLKTGGTQTARFLISHNIFFDGMGSGGGALPIPQPMCLYEYNIVRQPNAPQWLKALVDSGAHFNSNYFFASEKNLTSANVKTVASLGENNIFGPYPFKEGKGEALEIRPGVSMPSLPSGQAMGTSLADMASFPMKENPEAQQESAPFLHSPICVSSEKGAIIIANGPGSASGTLKYTEEKSPGSREISGIPLTKTGDSLQPIVPVGGKTSGCDISFAVIGSDNISPQKSYKYEIELFDAQGNKVASTTGKFRTVGKAKSIYVSADASGEANGSAKKPFGKLQDALNRVLPGDTIHLGKGVFGGSAIVAHGGTEKVPIVIQGDGATETLLDGGRNQEGLLYLLWSGDVTIRNIGFQWFKENGLVVENGWRVKVENCRFQNNYFARSIWPTGNGIYLERTPMVTISHCIFTRLEYGVYAEDSPQIGFFNNSGFSNLYGAAWLIRSTRDSKIIGNSFTFGGNSCLRIYEPDADAFASLVSDYNNFGTVIRDGETSRPENDFKADNRYQGYGGTSKTIIEFDNGRDNETTSYSGYRCSQMEKWRNLSHKDASSIFADPLYADPVHGDYRVSANSPNRIQKDGKDFIIGAESKITP